MVDRVEVLIVSSDLDTCRVLASVLAQWGLEPFCCSTVSEAREFMAGLRHPLIFCEDHLPDGTFRDVLKAAKSMLNKIRVVVTTRNGCRNEAFRLGAFNVISCPVRSADLQQTIYHAMRQADTATVV